MRLCVAAALLLTLALPRGGHADRARFHAGAGAGGFSALTGPARYGPAAEIDVYPGGAFGRFGVRVAYLGLEGGTPWVVTGGIAYTAAASRPKLHMALHLDGGAADGRGVAGGGVFTQLWLFGPVALGADAMAFLFFGDGDPSLLLGTALQLRLSW